MSQSGRDNDADHPPSSLSSSLGASSLDDSRAAASPFSREASHPGDALGTPPVDPASPVVAEPVPTVEPPQAWPSYPDRVPDPTQPAGGSPYGQPYGPPSAAPQYGGYGSGSIPSYGPVDPGYGAPTDYPPTPAYGYPGYGVSPYQPSYGGQSAYGMVAQTHPQATVAMVLGIVGLVVCPLVGIAGLVLGGRARREIDADPVRYNGRGMATAGYVLGILSIVATAFWVLMFVLGITGSLDS